MTLAEKKVEYFAEAITREVAARKLRARHTTANDLNKSVAKEIEAAEDEVNSRVEAARRELVRVANKKVADATATAKGEYIELRDSLRRGLLDDVTQDLRAFTRSDEYEVYLIERIRLEKVRSNLTVVKLHFDDMRFVENIRQATGLTIVECIGDFIGGFVMQSENGKVSADFTFKARLEKAGAV